MEKISIYYGLKFKVNGLGRIYKICSANSDKILTVEWETFEGKQHTKYKLLDVEKYIENNDWQILDDLSSRKYKLYKLKMS